MKKGLEIQRIGLGIFIAALLFFTGCEESPQEEKVDESVLENIEAKLDEVDSKRALLVESIIRSSPTLAETGDIFGELGSDFNRDYLSDINTENYNTLRSQGIHLGIYLADLAYISTYEQSQEVIFYLSSAQKMAEGIGVSNVFDESTVERMELNINDKDSIINMISELYWKTDDFLKELNRENISALIICGGWIEGMHIGSVMIEEGFSDDIIYQKILSQQNNVVKILTLLKTFEGDETIDMLEVRLAEIEDDFTKIPESEDEGISNDQKEAINAIAGKIEILRNEINQS